MHVGMRYVWDKCETKMIYIIFNLFDLHCCALVLSLFQSFPFINVYLTSKCPTSMVVAFKIFIFSLFPPS